MKAAQRRKRDRKITMLADLEIYRDATAAEVLQDHYAVERIFELLVMTASDIVFHLLAARDIHPGSYRESFKLAAEQGILPAILADRLGDAAGMRNIIAHHKCKLKQYGWPAQRIGEASHPECDKIFCPVFSLRMAGQNP